MENTDRFIISEQEINENNVKSAPDELAAEGEISTRDVKHIFDRFPELIAAKLNDFVQWAVKKFADYYTKKETEAVIGEMMIYAGTADMLKAVYDKNYDGTVDNADMVRGYWFAHNDADGNPTEELYVHWYEDENGSVVAAVPVT